MKKFFIVSGVVLIGLFAWSMILRSSNPDILSTQGLHWHANLSIIAQGKPVKIPSGIGLGVSEMAIHTHEADGTIHLEFSGVVHKEDTTLGQFFKVWGKDMQSFGSNMHMTINNVENTEYANYQIHDGDKIILSYE